MQISGFDLAATIYSGQVFRFDELNGYIYFRIGKKIIRLRQEKTCLEYSGCSIPYLQKLFQFNLDWLAIHEELSHDPKLKKAIQTFPGLRLIQQEPWECLVSFICSSASNIPRIKQKIDALCRLYGTPIHLNGFKSFSFPPPGSLCNEDQMRQAGLGYRARFLAQTNAVIHDLNLEKLRKKSYEKAKETLLNLPGVGEKVADCVLLFSLGFPQAFPVDVWIKRVMQEFYFQGRIVPDRDIRQFAQDQFGHYAGFAQQYLFHYARTRETNHAR